jgi:hypothetical protein
LVNKRNRSAALVIPGAVEGTEEFVDETTAFQPPVTMRLKSDTITLGGFCVAAVTLPESGRP